MASIHGAIYQPADKWEEWIDGQIQLSVAFEIASVDGNTHFYIRGNYPWKDAIESSVYSQYPEAEIVEVQDYTKMVPQNIPGKDWDLWGTDYKVLKVDHYPIKTYTSFETEHEATEEMKVDPVSALLEGLSKMRKGEQFWVQMLCEPMAEKPLLAWLKKGEELRDKLARRPVDKKETKPIIQEVFEILFFGLKEPEKKEKEIIPPEMKLTPGERETVAAIEQKMSKPIFKTTIRFIYLSQKKHFLKARGRMAFGFFNDFMTLDRNGLIPNGDTITKIKKAWFLPINLIRDRRNYLRCRRLFRNYLKRDSSYFPRAKAGGTFFLNVEEVASLFHFPSEAVAPVTGLARVETKRKGVPADLPIEQ